MWFVNLIFGFFIKRKAEREYQEGAVSGFSITQVVPPHVVSPHECMEARQGKYLSAWLSLARESLMEYEQGVLYGSDLPTKEETPDFVDKLDEELKRGYNG